MKVSTDKKILEHITKAALHLTEAADIAWKSGNRAQSDEIRGANMSIEHLCLTLLGKEEALKMRAKVLKSTKIVTM